MSKCLNVRIVIESSKQNAGLRAINAKPVHLKPACSMSMDVRTAGSLGRLKKKEKTMLANDAYLVALYHYQPP